MKKQILGFILGVLLFVVLLRIVIQPRMESAEDYRAKSVLDAYLSEKGSHYPPGSEAYRQFLKGVLLGEYPNLTGPDSVWLQDTRDAGRIIRYAATHFNAPIKPVELFRDWVRAPEGEIPEAKVPQQNTPPGSWGDPIQ